MAEATAPPNLASPTTAAPDWWIRPGLDVVEGRLQIAGRDAEHLAREHGTPLYVYDLERFRENARRFQAALATTGIPYRLRFAMKANPDPKVLAAFRALGAPGSPESVGIDACSPGEVTRALECGFLPDEISYTGTNVSNRDLDVILAADGLRLNLDAISQIERVGRRAPGRTIGIRVNPAAGAGYHAGLEYSGERPTKFGIYEDRLDEAADAAARHGLTIDTVHFHAGSGWLEQGLPAFERALEAAARMTRRLMDRGCPIREVNVGGGLGAPGRGSEIPVDLEAYAAVLARHLGPLGVTVACEPGDHLGRDAGLLLAEVVTVEDRGGARFVGLDAGWNVNCGYFIYGFLQEIVPCHDPLADRTWTVGVAGHINEGHDLFAEDYPFPPVAEGDIVAILGTGSYSEAMSSTHCLRPIPPAIHLARRD
ncbi:MAG: Diaminopimelate decarboxylase [Chloroflexi bacterium]|nr:Diaminopimelate decarboxylase [Chloroflexota bacterium]